VNFTVELHNDEGGGFWAEVKELPGCITQGDSVEEVEANAKEAIELALEGLVDDYIESLSDRPKIEPADKTLILSLKLQRAKTPLKT
jgi:predicted RNase H-like HicB family nuclease